MPTIKKTCRPLTANHRQRGVLAAMASCRERSASFSRSTLCVAQDTNAGHQLDESRRGAGIPACVVWAGHVPYPYDLQPRCVPVRPVDQVEELIEQHGELVPAVDVLPATNRGEYGDCGDDSLCLRYAPESSRLQNGMSFRSIGGHLYLMMSQGLLDDAPARALRSPSSAGCRVSAADPPGQSGRPAAAGRPPQARPPPCHRPPPPKNRFRSPPPRARAQPPRLCLRPTS